jgi:hypothetical protein
MRFATKSNKTDIEQEVLKTTNPPTILTLFNNAIIFNQLVQKLWERGTHRQKPDRLKVSLLRYNIAQNYRNVHGVVWRLSQNILKISHRRHI